MNQKTSHIQTLTSIQILRGFAALLIVVWHSSLAIELFANNYWPDVNPVARARLFPFWANHLNIGVDIFFCISGFIMAMLAHKAPPGGGWPFLRDRIIRIAPPYWFFTVLYLALYAAGLKLHFWRMTGWLSLDVPATIYSFLLLPQKNGPILAIGWTLVHEFFFYCVVCFVIALRQGKRLTPILAALALVSVGMDLAGVQLLDGYFLPAYYLEFFAGAFVFTFRNRLSRCFPAAQVAFAFMVYIGWSLLLDAYPSHPSTLLFSCAGGAVIGGLLISGLSGLDTYFSFNRSWIGRGAARLGDASYSLYLSHWFTLSLVGLLAAPFADAPILFIVGWQVAAILLAVLFALLLAFGVELPLHRRLASALTRPN